jgi:thiosulfate/3-mercaptopyruvate sulfurtransferase
MTTPDTARTGKPEAADRANPSSIAVPGPSSVLVDAATALAWWHEARASDAASESASKGTMPSFVLLDVRADLVDATAGRRAHEASRPSGAVFVDLDHELAGPKGSDPRHPSFTGRHPLPDRDAFARRVGQWGIAPSTRVVCFDAHGHPYAARAWWLLRWLGHARVYVLDGGLDAWRQAGGAMTEGGPPGQPAAQGDDASMRPGPRGPYPASSTPGMPVVETSNLQSTRHRIVDARTAERFRGETEPFDPVAGHIPGARNRFFKDNLDADGRFKPAARLRDEWRTVLGAEPAASIVHQCGSGVTACQNLLALMHAGWPATALNPGSWSAWCADTSRPVAVGGD